MIFDFDKPLNSIKLSIHKGSDNLAISVLYPYEIRSMQPSLPSPPSPRPRFGKQYYFSCVSAEARNCPSTGTKQKKHPGWKVSQSGCGIK